MLELYKYEIRRIILYIINSSSILGSMVLPMLGIYLFIFVLFLFSTWIVLGNKYALDYAIDEEGILIAGSKDKGGSIRKLAIVAGVIAGNPTVAGAGLMVRDNVIFIPWKDADDINIDHQKSRLIVKCSFWTQVAVHYPGELSEKVEQLVETYFDKSKNYV